MDDAQPGDYVDYEVNGEWYAGYVARRDAHTLWFKYSDRKFKMFEEPIALGDDDAIARLRASRASRSRPPAPVAATPRARPPAPAPAEPAPKKKKKPAKKATVSKATKATKAPQKTEKKPTKKLQKLQAKILDELRPVVADVDWLDLLELTSFEPARPTCEVKKPTPTRRYLHRNATAKAVWTVNSDATLAVATSFDTTDIYENKGGRWDHAEADDAWRECGGCEGQSAVFTVTLTVGKKRFKGDVYALANFQDGFWLEYTGPSQHGGEKGMITAVRDLLGPGALGVAKGEKKKLRLERAPASRAARRRGDPRAPSQALLRRRAVARLHGAQADAAQVRRRRGARVRVLRRFSRDSGWESNEKSSPSCLVGAGPPCSSGRSTRSTSIRPRTRRSRPTPSRTTPTSPTARRTPCSRRRRTKLGPTKLGRARAIDGPRAAGPGAAAGARGARGRSPRGSRTGGRRRPRPRSAPFVPGAAA